MESSAVRIRRAVNDGVVVGVGAATSELPGLVDRVAGTRVAVLSTPSVARSPLLTAITGALGDAHVVTFDGSEAHTPRHAVVAAAEATTEAGADTIVSLGGSSVVDMAKGVAMIIAEGPDFDGLRIGGGRRQVAATLPHLAVPTTLSAAEFTAAAGITDPSTGVKDLYVGANLAPRWVILDPEMAAATPDRLWRGTGMKLVADCIEGMLSPRATAYATALLTSALSILVRDLGVPADDLAARQRCLEAAHMTLSNLHNVGIGAVGALRHQLGGRCGVPHGEASTIVLPHVLRWNGDVAAPTLDRIAGALGADGANVGSAGAAGLIDLVETTIVELGLPTRLRDVGVAEDDLDPIAEHAAAEPAARQNVRPADASGLRTVLAAAW